MVFSASLSYRSLWTPANISTELWLDAADSSTVTTVSGAVSQWDDKSGNSRNATQGTAASRPTYASNALNQKSAIEFVAEDQTFLSTPSVISSNATSGYVFYIARSNFDPALSSTKGGSFLDGNWSSTTDGNHTPYNNGLIYDGTFSNFRYLLGNPVKSLASARLIGIKSEPNLYEFWIDGERFFQSLTHTFRVPPSAPILGRGYFNSSFYDGIAGELIVLKTLSTNTQEKIEGYLAHKWGLTANLPSGHPYKNNPPRGL